MRKPRELAEGHMADKGQDSTGFWPESRPYKLETLYSTFKSPAPYNDFANSKSKQAENAQTQPLHAT